MIKNFIKKIPGIKLLNNYMLERKLMNQFLRCNSLEIQHLEFYRQFINPNDLVFDVGANVGNRSKLFLNIGANVCAYEPQKQLCKHLNFYLRRNRSIKILNIGLSNKKGLETIRICDGDAHVLSSMSQRWIDSTQKSGRFENFQWNRSELVKVSTLDLQIEKYGLPKFIKIDVEGFELNVLKGLTQSVEALSLEFTAEELQVSTQCIEYVNKLGNYLFRLSLAEDFVFSGKWLQLEDMKYHLSKICKKNPKAWGDIYISSNSLLK